MKVNNKRAALIIVSLIILTALAIFACQGYNMQQQQGEIIGKNTFTQSMVQADGTEVNFYATGDQHFNYLHDENGYILLRNKGYLVYAKNQNGRPIPTQVKYQDSRQKIIALQKMTVSDIDFSLNPDLITDYPQNQTTSIYQSANPSRPLVNFVIFICFAGESVNLDKNYIDSVMSGPSNSLTDYYQKISYGEILVHNIYPTENQEIFIYQDPEPRSYYQLRRNSSSRAIKERTLLNNAIEASKEHFDYGDLDIDINDDGYVDAVNFLISGEPYSEWGGMLWPHSWDLDEISNGDPATIGNKKVKKYSFNFLEQLTVGLLTHEFAHVLGAPDLYHYEDNFAAVGNWDLMHFEGDTPQYMTTHMRHKYLNAIDGDQIETIEFNGIYSLRPVSITDKNQVLSYRINTPRPDEYFMVEYRNNNVSVYDSTLPGSGLIVYRVKQGVYGNADSLKQSSSHPDEVFVFRPNAVTTGSDAVVSLANLNKAYLSPENPDFSSVGESLNDNSGSSFDNSTLYYTNGENSGVVINALAINDNEITFEVRLSGDNNVSDAYFVDKLDLNNVKLNNDSQFSGVYAQLQINGDINVSNLNDIIIKLKSKDNQQTASIKLDRARFLESYNNDLRSFPIRFIINHKGNTSLTSVFYDNAWNSFIEPEKMELYVVDSDNDYIFLQQYQIDKSSATWQSIEMTNIHYATSIEASENTTIAIRDDGRAIISSGVTELDEMVLEDVISASAGGEHILYIKSNLKVSAAGNFNSGEDAVNTWENIIKVEAGDQTSFGLTLNGQVRSAGRIDLVEVNNWYNIIDIAVGADHIAALQSDGKVKVAGTFNEGQSDVNSWEDIVQITCGDMFTAGLTRDGQVRVAGELNNINSVEDWTEIVKIYAGKNHLLGITTAGRVLAVGNNAYGQLNTQPFYDIIDIAAGKNHSVALREDGKLLYAGNNDNNTNNIEENIIFYDNNYVEVTSLIAPFTNRILKTGDTYQLDVGVFPENASYQKISYSSSIDAVVSVTADGLMTANGTGTAVITAQHRGSDLQILMVVEVIDYINTASMIAAGANHSVILNNKGTVYAMGNNDKGQTQVNEWGNIVYIAAGGDTTVGVTPQGNVLVAGEMEGMGAEQWTDISYVSTSGSTIVGIKYNGNTVAVGDNQYQQIESFNSRTGIKQVATSRTHTVALRNENDVIAEGLDNKGQLNVDWRNIVKIAAGEGFSLGLSNEGKVFYAGECSFISDMTILSSWYDIVDIAASDEHIVAINSKGEVFAAGANSFGQTDVEDFEDIGKIAAGGQHTVGINNDGEIIGTGRNSDNRLDLPSVNSLPYIELIDVSLVQNIYGVKVGQTTRLELIFNPYNATDRKNISYQSLNPDKVQVDENGFITGLALTTLSEPAQIRITIENSFEQESIHRTIDVYVYENVNNITITAIPQKTVYAYQEKLDLMKGRARIDLSGDINFETYITADMVVNYETVTSALGERYVRIAVDDSHEAQYPIYVLDMVTNVELIDKEDMKKVYEYGDEIDLSGGSLRITRGYQGANEYPLTQLFADGDLEIIADTNLMGSTTVTLKYTDPMAMDEAGISLVHYMTYVIDVFDAVLGIEAQLDKNRFYYGEEIYGKGELIVNMKSGNNIYQRIEDIDENYQDGIDTRIVIKDYDKYIKGNQTITIGYYSPDFDRAYETNVEIAVDANVTNVEITSMMLLDRAVVDTNRHPEQSISARVYIEGGAIIDVGYDGEEQFFDNMRLSFNKGLGEINDGESSITMYVKVNSSITPDFETIYTINNLAIFGISEIQSLEIVGGSAFKYGNETGLQLRIVTTSQDEYNIDIDDFMLGIDNTLLASQTASFTLMGITATKEILFRDYVLEIYTRNSYVTTLFGEDPDITVYAAMASGAEQTVNPSNWYYENFDNEYKDHPQSVSIYYNYEGEMFIYNLTIEVLDEIEEVSVFSTPKTFYEVNQPLDMSSFSIRLEFLSGELSAPIYYNENEFSVTGFDSAVTGVQLVTITYKVTGDIWQYYFEVRNRILQILVDANMSRKRYTMGEELDLTVVLVYINGERDYIEEGFQHNFDNSKPGEQVVNITYRGEYTAAFLVEIIDAPREIIIKPPNKTHYQYGEMLDLEGGIVTIITQTGERRNETLTSYRNYLSGFDSTEGRGGQTITLSLSEYGVIANFRIYFADKADSNILITREDVDTIAIDKLSAKPKIVLEESCTLSQFKEMVDSYAEIKFIRDDSYIDYDENMDTLLSYNIKVEIINYEEILLESFDVYMKGDANGDGVFDEQDIPLLGDALLVGLEHTAIYADYTGDKQYTLTDFIKWVEKLEKQEEDSE